MDLGFQNIFSAHLSCPSDEPAHIRHRAPDSSSHWLKSTPTVGATLAVTTFIQDDHPARQSQQRFVTKTVSIRAIWTNLLFLFFLTCHRNHRKTHDGRETGLLRLLHHSRSQAIVAPCITPITAQIVRFSKISQLIGVRLTGTYHLQDNGLHIYLQVYGRCHPQNVRIVHS